MKDYKNYYPSANEKMIADASVIASYTFDGLESQDVFVDGVVKRVFIYDRHSSSQLLKNVISKDDSLTFGDILELENGQKWLIVTYDTDNVLYKLWVARLCNTTVKWLDAGIIHEVPCVLVYNVNTGQGISDDKVMSLPNGSRQLIVKRTIETMKFNRDKRFIFGDQVYKVIDYDNVSTFGLVNLRLESDQTNSSNDNFILGIADYFNNIPNYVITVANGSFASIRVDQNLQLNVDVYNKGKLVESSELKYEVEDESILNIDTQGLITPIKIGSSLISVSTSFAEPVQIEIFITNTVTSNYTVEIIGNETVNAGSTQGYHFEFRNNGELYPDESVLLLTGGDGGSTTNLASITSHNALENSCSIKFGNLTGFVYLHVKNLNGLSTNTKKIKIKPLW